MAAPTPFQELERLYLLDGFDLILENLKNDFRVFADTYFNRNRTPASHNRFFERCTPIWLNLVQKRHYFRAIKILNYALGLALDWQTRNRPNKIHKGTPYYFLGVTAILNNELENGFLAMHQAMKEDLKLSRGRTPQAPAFWFITLDSSRQNQFFKPKVDQMADYLSKKLEEYSMGRGGSLTLPNFRSKFLSRRKLKDEVFFLVYLLFKIRKLLDETPKIYKKNIFSSLLHARHLFDLCLISDKAIEYKNPARGSRHLSFRDEMLFLSSPSTASLSFNRTGLNTINNDFNSDFGRTMYDILLGRYHLSLSSIENDFAVAYGIRNFGAHRIENQPVVYNRMGELVQRIFNTLFFTVERLY